MCNVFFGFYCFFFIFYGQTINTTKNYTHKLQCLTCSNWTHDICYKKTELEVERGFVCPECIEVSSIAPEFKKYQIIYFQVNCFCLFLFIFV